MTKSRAGAADSLKINVWQVCRQRKCLLRALPRWLAKPRQHRQASLTGVKLQGHGGAQTPSLLLGHKGEQPVGRRQAAGCRRAGVCPHTSTAVFSLTRVSPCVSDAPGKGGSHRLPETTATGQSRGPKCIFHAQAGFASPLPAA